MTRYTLTKPITLARIIHENKAWYFSFVVFLIVGGIALTQIKTGDFIYFFSNSRTPFGDFFFAWFTKVGEEPTYILLILACLFIRFRYSILISITGIVTMIVSFSSKSFFLHDRPILYFEKLDKLDTLNLIEGVYNITGQTSFPSGHTMSGFALFGILALLLPKKNLTGLFCFLTALLIGISRVYLVQHFLKDIYLGAIMGTTIALLLFWLQSHIPKNEAHWFNRKIY